MVATQKCYVFHSVLYLLPPISELELLPLAHLSSPIHIQLSHQLLSKSEIYSCQSLVQKKKKKLFTNFHCPYDKDHLLSLAFLTL